MRAMPGMFVRELMPCVGQPRASHNHARELVLVTDHDMHVTMMRFVTDHSLWMI